jgi:prophage antirepressor-like protein
METLNNNQQATGLQTYLNENIGVNIRVKMINGEPWFSGKDVCYSIGISKYRDFLSKLDDDERVSTNMDTLGGNQQITVVNESGLYHLIFLSRKPEAKAFRKWVTNEVLPSIRRTGGYSVRPAQRPTLPAPKYRPDFIDWREK